MKDTVLDTKYVDEQRRPNYFSLASKVNLRGKSFLKNQWKEIAELLKVEK